MKNFRINREHLNFCPASLRLGREPKIVKLSMPQALYFKERFTSFEEMLQIYGANKQLKIGENYCGYAAVFNACWQQEVVFLDGELHPADKDGCYTCLNSADKNNTGTFMKVYDFNKCDYASWIGMLQLHGKLDNKLSPDDINAKIKEKLLDSIINDGILKLTDTEYFIIFSYDYQQFCNIFQEIR